MKATLSLEDVEVCKLKCNRKYKFVFILDGLDQIKERKNIIEANKFEEN